MTPAQIPISDGLPWSTLSLIILIIAMGLVTLILWRRYKSRRELMQRISELEALSVAGRAIVESEQDIEALGALIAQESGKVIDNSTFQVGIFEGDLYHILYWQIDGVLQTPRTFDLKNNSGVVGWVRDQKQPLLVKDFQSEMDKLPAKPRYISHTPPRSAIFLPLLSGDNAIGILAAQHALPNRFSHDDLRRLTIVANQAGAAFANAQLYAQVEERAAHLALLGRLAREINQIQDAEAIFQQVVMLTKETFGYFPVSIFLLDSETKEVVLQASTDKFLAKSTFRIPSGQGLVGTAAAQNRTIISNDVLQDMRYRSFESHPEICAVDTRSEIAIPISFNNQPLGVLDVQSNQIGSFSASDQITLETLAADVAMAIERARQYNRQQEQAWLTTAQFQMSQAISQNPDIETLAQVTPRLTAMLVGTSFCGIMLWNQEWYHYEFWGGYAEHHDDLSTLKQLKFPIGAWPALDALHVGQTPISTSKIRDWLQPYLPEDTEEIFLYPLHSVSEPIGVLIIDFPPAPTSPNDRRQELLVNISNQIGQALETAKLRVAQQEEAWVNTALLQVAEAVNSLTDLQEILGTIVRLVPMLVGVDTTLILIWDEKSQEFRVGPNYGINEMGIGLLQTLAINRKELNVVSKEQSDPTLITNYFTVELEDWLQKSLNTRSALALPLRARGKLVGVLLINNDEKMLSSRRLHILTGIAHQAATAVVNNQLYSESAERSRLEQELSVAREIQSSLIPAGSPDIPGCSVASYWEAARQVSGDFYDFLPFDDCRWGIVVADVADKGIPASLFMALSRTILRTVAYNRPDPADTLMRVNQIIDKDAQTDLFVTLFYTIWDSSTGQLTFANGGHNPPLLIRANGKHRLLTSKGIALGVLPDVTIASQTINFNQGDVLILYTDGVTEAINEDYDEFNLQRLTLTATPLRHQPAMVIMEAIKKAINTHVGQTPQSDDITLVVIKREK